MHLAAIIGDIVESKTATDREGLQHVFLDVLDTANRTTSPQTDLRITRGDEFEGSYKTISDAWVATLRLRLLMKEHGHDLWTSVAWGKVTALPEAPNAAAQDGPAWWMARSALTDLKQSSRQKSPDNRRAVFTTEGPAASLLSTAAILRDEVLAGLDASDATITLGLLDGNTQSSIARQLGITAGVVSRRAHRNGLLSLVESAMIDT
ncbi:MAG: hypothetical protein GY722_24400 [bacterium]|nr:hypothetical protein [bacterium]